MTQSSETAQFHDPPELLAPAGDFDCARAAVENGADAIYFGLQTGFNARARAKNIAPERLVELMHLLRSRGVKGYLTVNTLTFSSELEEVERVVRLAVDAGVDALLVQDLGVLRLVRAICPELPLHASTQMSLTSGECIQVAEELGIQRVVLPRELSIREIAEIRKQTEIELEAFVHGALCVAYSGQCLTSESLGGRSANRGQCAQACRMTYEMVCDREDMNLGDVRYLLSPQDLAAFDLVPELMAAGVTGLKIEGRLKTPEYVANITRRYREAIDTAAAGRPVRLDPQTVEEMELSFSRGFSHGWLEGCDHKALVPGLSSANRGVYLGEVMAVSRGRVAVNLVTSIKRGDGVVFDGDRSQGAEQGSRVYEVFQSGRSITEPVGQGQVELTFGRGAVDLGQLRAGQKIWKTDDPELTRRLRKTYDGDQPRRRVPLDLAVEAWVGSPLRITGRAASGATCRLDSPAVLEEAKKHPLTVETLREQLGRLGGTTYELRRLDAKIDGRPMVPLSVLGKLRHALVEQLDASIAEPAPRAVAAEPALPALRQGLLRNQNGGQATAEPQLIVLCRSLAQLETVLGHGPSAVAADFQDIREHAAAVQRAKAAGIPIYLATPRIQKPGEMGIFRVMLRHAPDGVLVRNLAGLEFFHRAGLPVIADFSLNATNELSVDWLIQRGAGRVTASYDMNRDQLLELASGVPPGLLEVVVHQHMPMFHMEHCVFCAVLSPGTNKTNCGRPCDRHEVRLRDRVGMEHTLKADVGCRNTLFNALPQSAAEAVPQLIRSGVRHFRIELLNDATPAELSEVIDLYRRLLAGGLTGKDVWTRLRASNRVGVTRGTLEQ